jgi:hypothetical protein
MSKVLALISVLPNYYLLYTSSWNFQMLTAEQLLPGHRQHGLPFPASIMVKITLTEPLSTS